MAKLRAISGPLSGQVIEVEGELVIGRQDTDVTIDDLELSRRHAVVRHHANRLQVEDLGSSNGTFVDGTRIEEPTLLGGGAEIRIGTTVLVVEGVLPVQSGDVAGSDAGVTSDVEGLDPDLARRVTAVRTVPPPPPPKETAAPAGATASAPPPTVTSAPPARTSAPPAGGARPQTPSGPVGEFRPPQRPRSGGLATRSWVPVALSFGTVVLVAIALVLYFALAK